ncbi:TRAP transporter small permease [Ancylobacter vacuolatus]|uniref:TRAP transporter small permease protein n=1 Tax=Ancylobacter vacuolatus TaxID=223389 RepID=A0ABU0DCT8_9HYPH|nr:TRAP transporter small permease [Ancylobacter vacuolatus]MDQ0346166.1 TRAP-type C4-dicarboxylate transport system permease small subunit [Ancylobacter vacuolatus]
MNQLLSLAIAAFYRVLEAVMVLCMVVMLVTVFGNVVLRLGFNTGIDLSDELPRFAFVWLTFLGAIVGLHRRAHLGVDLVVRALPLLGRKLCWGISQAIMLVCSLYMLYGTWLQHDIIAGSSSPVAQISTLWVYGVSYITSTAIGLICLANLVRLAFGHVADDELIDVNEEGMSEIHDIEHELADQTSRKGTVS